MLNKYILKNIIFLVSLTITLSFLSCTNQLRKEKTAVKFVILGNSFPSSPFKGFSENLPYIINSINQTNPDFIIYTGNIINGNSKNEGIIKKDIERQYKLFHFENHKKALIYYTVLGEKDLHNNSSSLYTIYTKKQLNYSFNHGNTHFIIFNNVKCKESISFKKRVSWLYKDLIKHKDYPKIYIITHNSFFSKKNKLTNNGIKFHNIIKNYKIDAVISGQKNLYYQSKFDNIRYINSGTKGFTEDDRFYKGTNYFVYSSSKNSLNIIKKKIKYISE